jgi:tetrahydromethanopterin S-methyltransferase subunit D
MTEREIKRIRNKFITVATLTLFGVMLLMGGFIYLFGVITVRYETYQIMEYIAENDGNLPEPD